MRSIAFARILNDGSYVAGLGACIHDARLAASLVASGFVARLYSGKRDGRIIDLVRQLVRMRTDAYVFGVSTESGSTVSQIARRLKELRPEVRILFWAQPAEKQREGWAEISGLGDLLFAGTAEEMFTVLSEVVPELSDRERPSPEKFSAYLSGYSPAEEVVRFGVTEAQPATLLDAELEWLVSRHLPRESIVAVHAGYAAEPELLKLCEKLVLFGDGCTFELHASASAVTQAVCHAMSTGPVKRLAIVDDIADLRSKPEEYRIEIVARGNGAKENYERRIAYSRNGMIAVHAGIYLEPERAPSIRHLEVPLAMDAGRRKEVYAWAAPNMEVRSAVVMKGGLLSTVEHLPELTTPTSVETAGWPKHSYAIGMNDSTDGRVFFDGDMTTKQKISYLPFSRFDDALDTPDTVTFVTVSTREDIAKFESQLRAFHEAGALHSAHPHRSLLFENSCRWLGYGACRLLSLRRLQVSTDRRLSTCRDSGEVGVVGDSFDGVLTLLRQRTQTEEVRRECAVCPVRDQCSKCAHLPEALGGEYCRLRKTYPQMQVFLALTAFPQILSQHMRLKTPGLTLRVSYTGLPTQFYRGTVGSTRAGQRPVIARVQEEDKNLAWWPGTRKLIRLSAPLAVIAEGWWSGAEEGDLVRELSTMFSVDRDTALSSLRQGVSRLTSEEIIHAE